MAADEDEAKSGLLAQGDFLAPGLIHEMRHPLMGIKAGLQLLERELGAAVQSKEEWRLVVAQVQRLEELFKGYQQFLHPEQLRPVEFDVSEVVTRALELLTFRLRPLGNRFSVLKAEKPARAFGVPSGTLHALINLIANALDALAAAPPNGRLMLRVGVKPYGVELRVADEGTGITPEAAARLFQPHFTTKQKTHGSGLGLAISRRMVSAGGGSLELTPAQDPERTPWAKTEFVIRLPISGVQPTTTPPPKKPTPSEPSKPATSLSGKTALLVDDEEVVLFVLRRSLMRLGVQFVAVGSAEEGARELQKRKFDLLITDKNLPGMNGIQLAAVARSAHPDIAVMVITGYASTDSASAALEAGVDEYLTKPFLPDELGPKIEDMLAQRSAPRATPAAGSPKVAYVETLGPERAALEQALARIGVTAVAGAGVAAALATKPNSLIVAAAELTESDRQALREWRQQQRPAAVVVFVEEGSLADSIVAISVGATASLSRTLTGAALEAALQGALAGGKGR